MIDLSTIDLSKLSKDVKEEILELLEARAKYKRFHKIEEFKPYKFQTEFYAAGTKYKRRFLCAANR